MGEEQYQLFRNEKIITRKKQLFATIPKPRKLTNEMKNVVKADIKEETIAAGRSIDYTRARSYDIRKLLTYELASTPFFYKRRISAKTRKIRVAEMYSNEYWRHRIYKKFTKSAIFNCYWLHVICKEISC